MPMPWSALFQCCLDLKVRSIGTENDFHCAGNSAVQCYCCPAILERLSQELARISNTLVIATWLYGHVWLW